MASGEQLYDSFADESAIAKQKDTILGYFNEVKEGVLELSKLGIKIDAAKGVKELEDATKNLTRLQGQLADANKRIAESERQLELTRKMLAEQTRKQVEQNKQVQSSYQSLSSEMTVNIARQKELQAKLKEIRSDLKQLGEFNEAAQGSKEFADEVQRLGEQEALLKVELEQVNRIIKNQTKEILAEEGSLDQMRARLNQMLQAYDAMGKKQKETDFGKDALKQIKDLTNEISKQEQAQGRFFRNVGNYQGSAKIIVEAFEQARVKVEALNEAGGQIGPQGEAMRKEFEALQQIVEDPKFLNVAAKVGDSTMEMRYMIKALQNLESQGIKDGEMMDNLRERLAFLQDSLSDTRQEVKAMSSDTRGFDLFAQSVGTVSSAFQVAASSAELFGGTNSDLQRSIQRLVAIQNIANGVRQIATDLTTKGAAANKALAWAQAQYTIVTNAAATATQRWAAALKLTGIGLLLAGIAVLVDKFGLLKDKTAEAEKELDKLNKTLEKQDELLARVSRRVNRKLTSDIAKIKEDAAIKSAAIDKMHLTEEQKNLKKQELNNITAAQIRAKQIVSLNKDAQEKEAAAKRLISSDRVMFGFRVQDLKSAQDALDILQSRMAGTDKPSVDARKDEAALQKVVEYYRQAEDSKTEAVALNSETRIEATELEAAQYDALAKKNKEYAKEEMKAASDLKQYRLGLEADYQAQLKQIEGAPTEGRTQAAQIELELRKQIVKEKMELELKGENLTLSQRKLIREKANEEIRQLEINASAEIVQIKIQEQRRLKELADEGIKLLQDDNTNIGQKKINDAKKEFDAYVTQLNSLTVAEKAAVLKRYKDSKLTKEQADAEIEKIDADSKRVMLDNEISFYEKILDIMRSFGIDTADAEKELAEIRTQVQDTELQKKLTAFEKEKELIAELKEKYKELGEAAASAVIDVIGGAFDAQKNKIQEQIDAIDILKAKEIERVNESGDGEEKKAARIKIIESRAAADKEALERRQKQVDRNKAVFERAFKAFSITADGIESVAKIKASVAELTAKAIANPFLAPLIPLAASQIPITIATHAASLAALLATPIPKYASGIESSPATWALVGEAGRELGIDKSGKLTMYDKPTLTYLNEGTKILPNKVTEDIVANSRLIQQSASGSKQATGRGDELLEVAIGELKEIKKKPTQVMVINTPAIETSLYYMYQMKR